MRVCDIEERNFCNNHFVKSSWVLPPVSEAGHCKRKRVGVRVRERERERKIRLLIDTLTYYMSLFANYFVEHTLGPYKLQGNKLKKKREGTGKL